MKEKKVSIIMLFAGLLLLMISIFDYFNDWRPILVILGILLILQYPVIRSIEKLRNSRTTQVYFSQPKIQNAKDPAIERLKELYAKGEINEEEFRSKKTLLED